MAVTNPGGYDCWGVLNFQPMLIFQQSGPEFKALVELRPQLRGLRLGSRVTDPSALFL